MKLTTKQAREELIAIAGVFSDKKLAISCQMGADALEKQIPKKPIQDEDLFYNCPCCGGHEANVRYDMQSVPDNGYKYCTNCGQRLDWSEENANT